MRSEPGAPDRRLEALEVAAAAGMAVAWHAAERPQAAAILSALGNQTYSGLNAQANSGLNAQANRLARALVRRGLRPGHGVALVCRNRPEFAEVMAATQRAGLRLTTVNWHLTGDEAAYIVGDSEARAVVLDDRCRALAPALAEVASCPVRLVIGGSVAGFEPYADALAAEDGDDIDQPTLGSTMLYTSGTTGRPKGVSRRDTPPAAPSLGRSQGYRPGSVHLCTGPLYHAAPLLLSLGVALDAGAPVVLMGDWDAEETLRLIERHRVTHTHMVPTMFHRLLSLPPAVRDRYDVSSLRLVLHGAAPCPVEVKRRIIQWFGPVVVECYAATEGGGTAVDSATWLRKPGTVGKPSPTDQALVGDEEARPLGPGEIGLVWLKAPDTGRFEYHRDAAKTRSTYRGPYFTLEDMGYLDADGFLFLTDRSANLIITGGVNVYPAEVDAVLLEHPAVGDVATIGVPNEEWGEEVKVVVEPKRGVEPTPELATELSDFCRGRLAHYKCPRSVDFTHRLPRDDSGKVYKILLRDRYRAATNTIISPKFPR